MSGFVQHNDSEESEAEYRRRLRREAQKQRRMSEDNSEREARRNQNTCTRSLSRSVLTNERTAEVRRNNTAARIISRSILDDSQRAEIRHADTQARSLNRNLQRSESSCNPTNNCWWDRVAILNTSQIPQPLGLRWNRNCKICGTKVCIISMNDLLHFHQYLWEGSYRWKNTRSMLHLRAEGKPLSAITPTISSWVGLLHWWPKNCQHFTKIE